MENDLYAMKHVDATRWKTINTDERFAWGKFEKENPLFHDADPLAPGMSLFHFSSL
jgi:hypothetical protein